MAQLTRTPAGDTAGARPSVLDGIGNTPARPGRRHLGEARVPQPSGSIKAVFPDKGEKYISEHFT